MLCIRPHLATTALLAALTTPLVAQQPDTTKRDTVTLAPVVISATAAERLNVRHTRSATKTDRLLRDVPQAVTVLSSALMADQAMQSMAEVARYIPGVTMGLGEGHRDAPTIRGNSSTADFYVDGIRDDAQYLRDLYNVARVEALKGSNAMVFGRGGGGGVINRVTKQPQWLPHRAVTVEGGSFEHKRTLLDLGSPLTRSLAVRLNGVLEHSLQFRDATSLERHGLNPTLALNTGATSGRLGYERFADRRTVNRGIPSFQGGPSNADIATFFGDPNQSHSRAAVDAVDATLQRALGRVELRNHTRFVRYDKFYQNVFPGSAVDTTGTQVNLSAYDNAMIRHNLFSQTDVTYALVTPGGAVRQTFLVGAELGRQWSDNYRRTGYFNDSATTLAVPFDRPTMATPVTFRQSATDADNHSTATVAALYTQHELTLGSHWQTVVGVRWDRFDLDFTNHRTSDPLRRVDSKVSPRAGLVFKPAQTVSLYASYSVSFLPSSGDQFGSLTVTTSTLEPERFENREAGLKWDLGSDLTLTGAVYRLERSNTTAPDPTDVTRVVQTGRQRTTGYEAALTGALTGEWQVVAGFNAQRATIVSQTTAAARGAAVPLVPHTTLSLWNRYKVAPWLAAGLGIVHQTEMFAAIDNTVTLPAFTRLDLAAYLTLSARLRAQLNVENLLDTRYYATSHGNNNIMPGVPRTVRLGMTVE